MDHPSDSIPEGFSPGSTDRLRPDRRHPVARAIIAQWRRLLANSGGEASGEPTLVACSGGADSLALSLALIATGTPITLAYVEHDARSRAEVEAERTMVHLIAAVLGAESVSLDARVGSGTLPSEARMRQLRYRVLAAEARRRGLSYLATGHHADDQLETVLLALLRGAGIAGMAGMQPSRELDEAQPQVILIRPMLGVSRENAEELCTHCGLARPHLGALSWVEDHTNQDTVYLRNRVRHEVVPLLESMIPGLAQRASVNAEWFRQTAVILRKQAIELDRHATREGGAAVRSWSRAELAASEPVIIGEMLRWSLIEQFDRVGLDRLNGVMLRDIAAAVQDGSTDPRQFKPGGGITIEVTAHLLTLQKKPRIRRGRKRD